MQALRNYLAQATIASPGIKLRLSATTANSPVAVASTVSAVIEPACDRRKGPPLTGMPCAHSFRGLFTRIPGRLPSPAARICHYRHRGSDKRSLIDCDH